MPVETPPRRPLADWEAKRDEWIAAVEGIVAQAEAWAIGQGWLVHRSQKTITEDQLGTYEVPVLTIQTPNGPLILDPIARFIIGALGRVDLCVFPSYEKVIIARTETGWQFVIKPPVVDRPWSESAFLDYASQLAKQG